MLMGSTSTYCSLEYFCYHQFVSVLYQITEAIIGRSLGNMGRLKPTMNPLGDTKSMFGNVRPFKARSLEADLRQELLWPKTTGTEFGGWVCQDEDRSVNIKIDQWQGKGTVVSVCRTLASCLSARGDPCVWRRRCRCVRPVVAQGSWSHPRRPPPSWTRWMPTAAVASAAAPASWPTADTFTVNTTPPLACWPLDTSLGSSRASNKPCCIMLVVSIPVCLWNPGNLIELSIICPTFQSSCISIMVKILNSCFMVFLFFRVTLKTYGQDNRWPLTLTNFKNWH